MDATPEFSHLETGSDHELREAMTLTKGWLQAVLKNWREIDDHERESMVMAALFGVNRVAFLLDVYEGKDESAILPATERTAEDFLSITDPRD